MLATVLTLALLGASCAWLVLVVVVPRLPEPQPDPGPEEPTSWRKPPYRSLATGRNQLLGIALGAVAGAFVHRAPTATWPALLVMAGPGAALVLVDALTTYLPRRLNHACAALLALALAAGALWAHDTALPARAIMAGAGAMAFFWLLWRVGVGFGFGDVRLVALIGACSGTVDIACTIQALLLGTIAGALWGLVLSLWRRRHPHPLGRVFAYGPCLWAGLWLALAAR